LVTLPPKFGGNETRVLGFHRVEPETTQLEEEDEGFLIESEREFFIDDLLVRTTLPPR